MSNIKQTILILFLFILSGCEQKEPNPRDSLANFKCKKEDLESVEKLYKICNNSSYYSDYCYLRAVNLTCEFIGEVKCQK